MELSRNISRAFKKQAWPQKIVQSTRVFSPKRCGNFVDELYQLKKYWEKPGWERAKKSAPFFTLGFPSYFLALGICSREEYLKNSEIFKKIIWTHFSELLEDARLALETILQEPVDYHSWQGWPGFHIFEANKAFEKPLKRFHVDIPLRQLDWEKNMKPERTITFTLPLELPKSGGQLEIKNIQSWQMLNMPETQRNRWLDSFPSEFVPYKQGHLYVHSGSYFHRIAPWKFESPEDRRITFQGQGVMVGRRWKLFW